VLGPSGPSTIADINVRPATATPSGDGLAVDLLTQDGKAVNIALPTSEAKVQDALAPVGSLVGVVAGKPAGDAVVDVTNALSPAVAAVTPAVDGVLRPVLDGVNGVLAPVVGEGAVLAPVTSVGGAIADGLVGGIGGSDPARSSDGPLLAAAVGGSAVTGASTNDTIAAANLLSNTNTTQGQLVTASVLGKGAPLAVSLPATAEGGQAGLAPVGNLVGSVLGEQAGAAVDQVTATLAPVAAPVTSVAGSALGGLGGTANPIAGNPVAPVTGVVGSLLGNTGLGNAGPLAPVTGVVSQVLGGATSGSGTPAAGSVLAPVTNLLGGALGGLGK